MGKPKRERSLADTEAKAVARNLRVSPQKLNLVAELIRGKKVDVALNDLTFSFMFWVYLGSSWTRLVIWVVTSQAMPPRTSAAERTTRNTAGVRPSPRCRNHATNGLSRKVRKTRALACDLPV